jgi:rhodanese-related sulfurtransferase
MAFDEVLEPDVARELIASNEATVVDIREDEDWHERRVPGAVHAFEGDLGVALEGVDDQRPLIIVCGDGERSASLAAELRERGREVASIEGGMKAWEGEKLPMQPSSDPDDDVRV